jgi:RNA polymerase-associated protein LEO1
MTTIRWRRSPSKPDELQSNARLLRWSDGSVTLQFASDPRAQYEIEGKPLAPPQRNPRKPTPITGPLNRKGRNIKEYDAEADSFTYLVSTQPEGTMMRVTNKVTAGLQILPAANTTDAALEKLKENLALARASRESGEGAVQFTTVTEDPENMKRKAEQTEKEVLRQQRVREKAEQRERERNMRPHERSGRRSPGIAYGFEGEEGTGRKTGRTKPRRPRRHEDWSDDDDYITRGKTREDEYDEEDDFIAASDEEPEIVDDEDDLDDGIEEAPTPKRSRADEDADDSDGVRRKKRKVRIVDDDEDE